MTAAEDFLRRSFAYRKLESAGASFQEHSNGALATQFGDPAVEVDLARKLGLIDLSPVSRCGFKGKGTMEWLQKQGVAVPEESNRAQRQAGNELAARLAPTEILILGDPLASGGGLAESLPAAWASEAVPPKTPRGFPLPRQDSHAWFLVTGEHAATMFAKICGVDLRPAKFPDLSIAQTSVARINAVVIRDDRHGEPAYHLLFDSASAHYLWDCLIDAMEEFCGAPVGLAALKALWGG